MANQLQPAPAKAFVLVKNTQRYEGIDKELPDSICCFGTSEQAAELARRLSNWNAGCDYAWYVEGLGA